MGDASIITIILFFVYTWGLGYGATYFFRKSENFYEKNFLRIAIGLGLLPIIVVILSVLRIGIDWKIILALSLLFPVIEIIKRLKNKASLIPKIDLRPSKANINFAIVLLLFFATLFMYETGAFNYPWLEDDDPWGHTAGIMYVKYQKTVLDPREDVVIFPYLGRNYAPAYDGVMGMIHQTSPYRMWTVKFFNALIISLGIIFFYFFAKRLMNNSTKALFATFVLTAIPCYLSHFIWAHALIPTLLFPFIYCIDMIRDDKRYAWLCAFLFASFLVIQPGHAIKIGVISGLFVLVRSIKNWKFLLNLVYVHILGGLISLIWWFQHAGTMLGERIGQPAATSSAAKVASLSIFQKIGAFFVAMFPPGSGTATRVYSVNDFFVAKSTNMINNPIGVGIMIYLLLFIFLLLMFIYIIQRTAELKKQKQSSRLLYYSQTAINFLTGVVMVLLAARYVTAVTGTPVFTSLFIDLYAILLVTVSLVLLHLTNRINEKEKWITAAMLWLLFTFLGINSLTFNLPVGLMAFRFWMLFAIPAALLAAEGVWMLNSITKKFRIPLLVLMLVFGIMIITTSGVPKWQVNTAMWSPGATLSATGQTMDYVWLKENLPLETMVYTFDYNHRIRVPALDKYSPEWIPEIHDARKFLLNLSVDEIYTFLKKHGYEYVIGGVNAADDRNYGPYALEKLKELSISDKFTPAHQSQTSIILKVK